LGGGGGARPAPYVWKEEEECVWERERQAVLCMCVASLVSVSLFNARIGSPCRQHAVESSMYPTLVRHRAS